jgi:hypothetical protein
MPHRVRTTTVDAWWCRLLGRRFDARGCVAAIAAAAAAHPMPGVTDRRALTAWAQTAVPLLWQIWPHPERLRPDAAWVTEALASRGGAGPSPATIADLMCQAAAIVIEGRGGDVDGVAAGLLILARPDLRGTCPRLLIDEAQDLNRLQIAVCAHLVGDGRVIAIGDPAQAIYGFRGSDHQAMEHLRAATGMGPPLSLPCSWRCPRRVVAFAAAIVPHLTAAPGAPEGKVEHREASAIDQTRSDLVSAVHEGRDVLLLSRVGAPLVEEALCLGDRLGPGRVGLRLGPGLGVVADDLRRAGLDRDPVACHTIEALVAWYRPALAQHAGPDRDRAHERLDLALTLARAAQARRCTLRQVLAGLAPRPGPGGRRGPRGGVLVATIHQAKGLEGDLCVVWGSDRMPHPRVLAGGSAAAIREEAHLAYVAATRTRDHLILQELPTRHP